MNQKKKSLCQQDIKVDTMNVLFIVDIVVLQSVVIANTHNVHMM